MKKAERPIRMLLTGGGTGGHLFPAIAAAEAMCARRPGSKIMFVGTRRKMDRTSLAGYGYEVKSIHCFGLKGKKIGALIKAVAVLPISFVEAMVRIITFRPDVVLGVGGYVTGPVIAAAKFLGKKAVIHEQNSIPGLANRKLGSLADRICISIPESGKFFPEEKVTFSGNPVRKQILELAEKDVDIKRNDKFTILILGGSQGAHRVNELVVEALTQHKDIYSQNIKVIHQTGVTDCDMVKNRYQKSAVDANVQPFFQDMVSVYKKADLLVSRAGATTLAELAVLGKPAILIPYPHAADNHQDKNADHYVEGGGCVKFSEHALSSRTLAEQIESILANVERRSEMSKKMINLSHPMAAEKIVDVCIENIDR
jgi:UDP-N-acetylglucosamine--N-acetylmuramyl-(pentapeptide) pyrophosphoryl-undecaprenol N-acetylglucosamine transferase